MFGVSLCVEGGAGFGGSRLVPYTRVNVYEFIEDFPASWVVFEALVAGRA